MGLKQILSCAMDIGETMLVSGAGVSRVEDTIRRICYAYDAKSVEVYSITTSIVATVTSCNDIFTQTKRIRFMNTDFHKLDRLNDLSRSICADKPDVEEIRKELNDINCEKHYSLWHKCLVAGVIAGAFTAFYGGEFGESSVAVLIGALVTVLQQYLDRVRSNRMFSFLLMSALVASGAILAVHGGVAENYGVIIIGNIMLLVPGVAFVNAIRDVISGDIMAGIIRLCEVMVMAVFLAGGSFVALVFWRGIL